MNRLLCALAILALFVLSGCFSTTDVRTYRDLSEALPYSLRVMTVDTTVYDLKTFSFTDTLVEGEGEHSVGGQWIPFSGRLPMSRIVYMQTRNFNFLKTCAAIGLAGLTASWLGNAAGTEGLSVWRTMGGGGSCPSVYAWNGEGYVLQGEVFGTALGRALETSTACTIPDASGPDGLIRIRIADERPETHYVNSVRLCAYEAPRGTPVFLDTRDRAWPLPALMPPRRAPGELLHRDNLRWKSDPARRGKDYHDRIEITLPRTGSTGEGSLVVRAINTHLSESAFETLFGFLGDESLPFLYRLERDPGTIGILKGWIEECGLRIDVWTGAAWRSAGVIPPEANEVPFTRIVRIPAPDACGDSVRIRLTMLADTWEIDAVGVDWSPALPLPGHTVPLLSALHTARGSVADPLRSPDAEYVTLLPGESVDMTFGAYTPREGEAVTYAFQASGYLYEWLPDQPRVFDLPEPLASVGARRIDVAGYLLGNHDAFLPLLYSRWDATRHTSP